MTVEGEGKVGSKGELFPPKKIREAVGLVSNQRVKYSAIQGRLVVEKIPGIEEKLAQEPKIVVTLEELKQDRWKLSGDLEK